MITLHFYSKLRTSITYHMNVLMTKDSSWPSSAGRLHVGLGNKLQNMVLQIKMLGGGFSAALPEGGKKEERVRGKSGFC